VADKQTVLKLIRLFMSRNMFTKLQFYDSLIWTENALKLTYVHLNFQKFSEVYPSFTGGRDWGMVRVGKGKAGEGRGMCSPKQSLE
jgi:hypothetical protein